MRNDVRRNDVEARGQNSRSWKLMLHISARIDHRGKYTT